MVRGWKHEDGQSVILMIVAMISLIGFTGIAIDVGYGMLEKRRLQAAVDLGLLSGARALPGSDAEEIAAQYVEDNFESVSNEEIAIDTSLSCMVEGCSQLDRLALTASTETPTFFLPLFGVDQWTVGADGAACGPCDATEAYFDVVVVVDRSYSMCVNAWGWPNGCYDLEQARDGVMALLDFFDPDKDRISLAAVGPGDSNSCSGTSACPSSNTYGRPYSHTTAGPSYNWVTNTSNPYPCDSANPEHAYTDDRGRFWRSLGDFMDGSAANHDNWVLVGLQDGDDFRNDDGSINENSDFVETLECLQHKYWTPIAPSIDEARQELLDNQRVDDDGNPVTMVIIYLGDGGATAQPMRRQNDGDPTSTISWYTPTAGNNNRPCRDAIAQAERAREDGIVVYTIGYAVGEGSASACTTNSGSAEPGGIDARTTLQQMADDDEHYFEQPEPGEIQHIFQEIGHSIVSGGVRLVA